MKRSHVFLACVVCGMFIAAIVGLFLVEPPVGGREALLILIGSLAAAFGAVVQYWFGSSASSAAKNEILQRKDTTT